MVRDENDKEKRGVCIQCGESLSYIDDDLNGEWNSDCVRCRAEDDHDYDIEPLAVYDRCGRRVDLGEGVQE